MAPTDEWDSSRVRRRAWIANHASGSEPAARTSATNSRAASSDAASNQRWPALPSAALPGGSSPSATKWRAGSEAGSGSRRSPTLPRDAGLAVGSDPSDPSRAVGTAHNRAVAPRPGSSSRVDPLDGATRRGTSVTRRARARPPPRTRRGDATRTTRQRSLPSGKTKPMPAPGLVGPRTSRAWPDVDTSRHTPSAPSVSRAGGQVVRARAPATFRRVARRYAHSYPPDPRGAFSRTSCHRATRLLERRHTRVFVSSSAAVDHFRETLFEGRSRARGGGSDGSNPERQSASTTTTHLLSRRPRRNIRRASTPARPERRTRLDRFSTTFRPIRRVPERALARARLSLPVVPPRVVFVDPLADILTGRLHDDVLDGNGELGVLVVLMDAVDCETRGVRRGR